MSITVAPNITQRIYKWTDWKAVSVTKGIVRWQHDDDGSMYTIWGYDGPEVHLSQIWKGILPDTVIQTGYSQAQNDSDKADFEANYLPTSNRSLEPVDTAGFPRVIVEDIIADDVMIKDGAGSNRKVSVDSAYRLFVATPPPIAPVGTTAVNQIITGSVSGQSFIDSKYIIPNNKTLTIQRFAGGSEGGTGNAQGATKTELFYDPNGNGTGMTLIRIAFSSNNNYDFALDRSFTGNGTKSIRVRRTRMDSQTREVYVFWDGFYV